MRMDAPSDQRLPPIAGIMHGGVFNPDADLSLEALGKLPVLDACIMVGPGATVQAWTAFYYCYRSYPAMSGFRPASGLFHVA